MTAALRDRSAPLAPAFVAMPLAMGWLVNAGGAACTPPPPEPERHPTPPATARSPAWTQATSERGEERARMVETQLRARGIQNERVLEAMRQVPRHRFVERHVARAAYSDGPLPIVGGQTISQPYIVAFMSEAADIQPTERCLEIGTGSGYQAAILAELCQETYSIEYLASVAAFGRARLASLGYLERSLSLRVGDGYAGWPEKAPFDAILVTAAPARVPAPLLEQLAPGGRLVIPVGDEHEQQMEVWTRVGPGNGEAAFERTRKFGVRFVPFLGPGGK